MISSNIVGGLNDRPSNATFYKNIKVNDFNESLSHGSTDNDAIALGSTDNDAITLSNLGDSERVVSVIRVGSGD